MKNNKNWYLIITTDEANTNKEFKNGRFATLATAKKFCKTPHYNHDEEYLAINPVTKKTLVFLVKLIKTSFEQF